MLADYVNGMHGRLKEARKSAKAVLAENGILQVRLAGEKNRYTLADVDAQFLAVVRGKLLGVRLKSRDRGLEELRGVIRKYSQRYLCITGHG